MTIRYFCRLIGVFLSLALMAPTWNALPTASAAAPRYAIDRVVGGLEIPWDITWVGNLMLFNEREGRVWSKRPGADRQRVQLALPPIYNHGEGGLLGMVADPAASSNRYFYTCMSVMDDAGRASDVQVWKWRLTSDTTAQKVGVLVRGIPIEYGRHNGCRLRFRSTRMLYIGTGDATDGRAPQALSSLAGKILRVRSDGSIPKTNPFYHRGGNARYVWNYGHRNVQGLAKRPGVSELWSVEHGPDRDDEVNQVIKGGNYGWNPVPGYNESVSMTDTRKFPKAKRAKWSSGRPTVATSGATFLSGRPWQDWNGMLAVAMLTGQGVALFQVDRGNHLKRVTEIANGYGRIRTVQQGPDGALYFATSNGSDDSIYRLAPS